MRVAVVAEREGRASGTADYGRGVARELRARGVDVEVAADPRRADVVVYNHTPYVRGVRLGWLRSAILARRLARRGRLVVFFHEVFRRPDDRAAWRLFERAQRWSFATLERLAAATVVADELRAAMLRELVPGARPPAVIPIGPPVAVPDRAVERGSEPVVLCFGLLQARRDLETLVDAAALAAHDVAGLRLVLVGDLGDDPGRAAALETRARRAGAPLELTGRVPPAEVAARFAQARVFVSGYTDRVSFGSSTLPVAFAHGLPVIVYADADLDPALAPARTVLVAERTPAALADAIRLALSPAADGVARAGRELYERELSWPRIGDRWLELLAGIAPDPSATAKPAKRK